MEDERLVKPMMNRNSEGCDMAQSGRVFHDNEMNPLPLGDLMIDYLHGSLVEWANVDFKLTIDISRDSDFAKIAEDIFGMANFGGGWLMFGYDEPRKGKIIPRGLDDTFSLDQASLQEKFRSYASDDVDIEVRQFQREVDDDGKKVQRLFLAMFVHPSKSLLVPKKQGFYIDASGRKKIVFEADDIITRRGTQTVKASEREKQEIRTRLEGETYRQSLLRGTADAVDEILYSNLLRVIRLPSSVYSARLKGNGFPFSSAGRRPFFLNGGHVYSFHNLAAPPFFNYLEDVSKVAFSEMLSTDDGVHLVTALLNIEMMSAMRTRRLLFDEDSRVFYFPLDEGGGDARVESWGLPGMGRPRKVVRKLTSPREGVYWRHYSVGLRFERVDNTFYLGISPGIIVSRNGKTPLHGPQVGPLLIKHLHRQHNKSHLQDVRFWASLLPRFPSDSSRVTIGPFIELGEDPVSTRLNVGISFDRPVKEMREGIPNLGKVAAFASPRAIHIAEPRLVFGGSREEEDPRLGMRYFGPFHAQGEEPLSQMRIGLVATGRTIPLAGRVLDLLESEQESVTTNRYLFPSFPGLKQDNSLACKIVRSATWNAEIPQVLVERIVNEAKDEEETKTFRADALNERIAKAVGLYVKAIERISMEDNRPQLILCVVPDELYEYCGISEKTRRAKRKRRTKMKQEQTAPDGQEQTTLLDHGYEDTSPKSYDLRDAVKGQIMRFGIPVQFLVEKKLRAVLNYTPKSEVQEPATFCWNLGTGMYYKADGKPWRLAKLDEGTCYVGIAFFRSRLEYRPGLNVSMAQVFTHSGDGLVLRGKEVYVDQRTREAHMSSNSAEELLREAISKYTDKVGAPPSRVVVHKTSSFEKEERQGFLAAIGDAKADFVAIRYERGIRFMRTGKYPVLRGTLITLSDRDFLLYTTGYIPRLRTYPGPRVPTPLRLTMDCDSSPEKVAAEVLKLTKINWNTTAFADKEPITIRFPKRVGKVLSELPDGAEINSHYRFYM
ncbi:MAG: hypothetical protein HXY34_05845 [Candidatus Thorarchaeota archaeon]|nr:hypothetical protein [Candidatus Thorarchaeota archaeon]